MPRQIFKKCVISAAGPLPGQLTVENLTQWTRIRKGVFSNDFDECVTHLLCTREQFNKRVPRVREALKRGKRFHIVHYDWFEFSAVHEKKEREAEYSMRALIAKQKAREREERRVQKGIQDAEKFVNTNMFHIYTDREFFSYQIDITRDDAETGEPGQRYTMCLWESDAKPHLYQFTAKFLKKKGDGQPSYYRPSPCAGRWRDEMDHFTTFFQKKTGIDWQDRVLLQQTTGAENFQYIPPTGGKPVGRRLRHSYDYCLEINAQIRGLAWPPAGDQPQKWADVSRAGDILAIQGGSDVWDADASMVSINDSRMGENVAVGKTPPATPSSTQESPDDEDMGGIISDDQQESVEKMEEDEFENSPMGIRPLSPCSQNSAESVISCSEDHDGDTATITQDGDVSSRYAPGAAVVINGQVHDARFVEAVRKALSFPVPDEDHDGQAPSPEVQTQAS